MAKRPHETEDFERQWKKVVTESMVNENDALRMNQVYEKTNQALFNGAKNAFESMEMGQGHSTVTEPPLDLDENDVEMEEYFKDGIIENAEMINQSGLLRKVEQGEIIESLPPEFSSLDKSEVNRLIRLQRRSPSPFPRVDTFKCCYCFDKPLRKENIRQICLQHLWGFPCNQPSNKQGDQATNNNNNNTP